jgi:hypothetical protein
MVRVYSTQFFMILVFVGALAPVCMAGWEDYIISYNMAYSGSEVLSLMVVPDGSGPDFTEAKTANSTEDATITLEFLDALGTPVAGYPAEDMWLESEDGGMSLCAGGTVADGATDTNGRTTFSQPPRAGGWSSTDTWVLVNGSTVFTYPPVTLNFNSPDITGDRAVNLSDVQAFAGDFYGSYHYRSDLAFDGVVNLSDIVPLSQAMGANCP